MGRWSKDVNQYVEGSDVVLAASAARTATGNTGWINCEQYRELVAELDVTAVSGTTPTLDVLVETAEDNAGQSARSLGSFPQKTGVSNDRKSFAGLDNYYRLTWTIAGTTPSFTFSLVGVSK
jgi:tetrahydromethanopterin S-methyltransferase subunit B